MIITESQWNSGSLSFDLVSGETISTSDGPNFDLLFGPTDDHVAFFWN